MEMAIFSVLGHPKDLNPLGIKIDIEMIH